MKWTIVFLGTSLAVAKAHHHHHGHHHHHTVTTTVNNNCGGGCTTFTKTASLYIPDPTTETEVQVCTTTVIDEVTTTQCILQTETSTVYFPTTTTAVSTETETSTATVTTTKSSDPCKGGCTTKKASKPCGCAPTSKSSACDTCNTPAPVKSSHKHHHHHHHHHKCHHHAAKYTVQSGDCCYGIALANGITVADLKEENPSLNAECDLTPGEILCISTGSHHHHHHARGLQLPQFAEEADDSIETAVMMDSQDGVMQKTRMSSAGRNGLSALAAVGVVGGAAGLLLA